MTSSSDRHQPRTRTDTHSADTAWLNEVAESASRDAGGAPVELLGDYLPLLADAATSGREPHPCELEAVGQLGRRAAELDGVGDRLAEAALGRGPSPPAEYSMSSTTSAGLLSSSSQLRTRHRARRGANPSAGSANASEAA